MRTTLVLFALLAIAACGTEEDDRSPSAEYIVPAITRPSCGTAACHSTATAREGVIMDTVEGMCGNGPFSSLLTGLDEPRMPLDAPLPYADIALIQEWEQIGIDTGDFPGCP